MRNETDMDKQKLVSIIVPVYNNELYIDKCIKSMVGQTYQALEIILVDDGSSDRSAEIIRDWSNRDSRIKFIQKQNGGTSSARNAGLDIATGMYLTFVDGDDYLGKEYIESFVKWMNKHDADMVICGLQMVTTDGKAIQKIIPGPYIRGQHEEWAFRISAVAAHFYKREDWEKYHIRFHIGERGEDIPIAFFFSAVCRNIVTLPNAEYYYVQHEKSASSQFQGLRTFSLPYEALEEMIERIQKLSPDSNRNFQMLFLMRIFSTFIYLAKGAENAELDHLSGYIMHVLRMYYPDYSKNPLFHIWSGLDIPFMQRAAVWTLTKVCKHGMLKGFLRLVC